MPEKMFVTCLYGVLDIDSGLFRFANAGHDLPYVQTADGVVELRARGMPLGLMPGMSYEEKEATLQPGDSVLLHSDGVLEAHDPEREMFGSPRLKETMARGPGGRALIDHVLSELAAFTGPGRRAGGRHHDGHAPALCRRGAPRPRPPTAACSLSSSCRVRPATSARRWSAWRARLPVSAWSPRVVERLKTAVAEATMNAMEHGNEYRADRPVSIRVTHTPERLSVHVTDLGEAAELPAAEKPDLEAKLEGRQKPRGWGLLLIEKMVDEARVTNEAGKHTVELVLRLKGGGDDDE